LKAWLRTVSTCKCECRSSRTLSSTILELLEHVKRSVASRQGVQVAECMRAAGGRDGSDAIGLEELEVASPGLPLRRPLGRSSAASVLAAAHDEVNDARRIALLVNADSKTWLEAPSVLDLARVEVEDVTKARRAKAGGAIRPLAGHLLLQRLRLSELFLRKALRRRQPSRMPCNLSCSRLTRLDLRSLDDRSCRRG
jgi:hypothetical protein